MVVFPLSTGVALATPGALDAVPALYCTNPHCRAAYPVFDGIPVVFAQAGAVTVAQNLPLDVTSVAPRTLRAALDAAPSNAPLCETVARVARYAWAGFADWSNAPPPAIATPVHAVEVVRWLDGLARPKDVALRCVMGAALGREAWQAGGATLLADAHLASLLAARRLAREGCLDLLLPGEPGRWIEMCVEVPTAVQGPDAAWVCCDAASPPFYGEAFDELVATNLLDSVSDPFVVLGQCSALVHDEGVVALTTPFAFREHVTPARNWWSTAHRDGAEACMREQLEAVAPQLRVVHQREFVWALWGGEREMSVYRSAGFALAHAHADPDDVD